MMTKRKCVALKCGRPVAEKYLMCGIHWSMVPPDLQSSVWREYFAGKRKKKHPTPEYFSAVEAAKAAVAAKERPVTA